MTYYYSETQAHADDTVPSSEITDDYLFGDNFQLFPKLPPELRLGIWDFAAAEMIPYESRVIEIPCDHDMAAEACKRFWLDDNELLPVPEEFLKTHGPQLMPRLRAKYTLAELKSDRIYVSESDTESDRYLRHPLLHACQDSRHQLLRHLVYLQHPLIPQSGFLMHPPSDVLMISHQTTLEQLRLVQKYYPQEHLNQIQAMILDENKIWKSFIDEDAELPMHLSDVLDVFQGVRTVIIYSISAWWNMDGPEEHTRTAKELKERDERYVAWLKERDISVEYHDEEGNVYGFI